MLMELYRSTRINKKYLVRQELLDTRTLRRHSLKHWPCNLLLHIQMQLPLGRNLGQGLGPEAGQQD